jgi:septum site-determining protein MinD
MQDKRNPKLHVLAASQTKVIRCLPSYFSRLSDVATLLPNKDKDVLTEEGVRNVLDELKKKFDFVVLDSPAGIESGAKQAMFFADDAIICVNPEVSSCRDSDKMVGFIASKSERATLDLEPVQQHLLVTRWNAERAELGEMLSLADIKEILGLPLLGVIPESPAVLTASNMGQPVIMGEGDVAEAYKDLVARFLGEERELQFIKPKPQVRIKEVLLQHSYLLIRLPCTPLSLSPGFIHAFVRMNEKVLSEHDEAGYRIFTTTVPPQHNHNPMVYVFRWGLRLPISLKSKAVEV